MPKSKPTPQKDFKWLVGILGFFLIAFSLFLLDRLSNKPAIRNQCRVTKEFSQANQTNLAQLLTQEFEKARECGNKPECLVVLKKEISDLLTPSYFDLYQAQSIYFVRSNRDGLIEKMFLGGDYYAKTPEKLREKFFLWHLTHNVPICDYFWKNDVSTTSMTYLRDFTGEAEVLIPFGIYNGYHTGIVRVWGD